MVDGGVVDFYYIIFISPLTVLLLFWLLNDDFELIFVYSFIHSFI